ncbi:MAG: glycosyltransferase family 4 protein [Actinomycetota bacterium]|nr:glycosyltransferase family 4 protein [Actinomycetota bacterium]
MRVLIDMTYAARGRSGSSVYIERLVDALRERGQVGVVEARQRVRLRPGAEGGAMRPLRRAANLALDALWLHVGLPRAARRAGADVVHHPLPAHSRRIRVPQVSTVQDVAFLHFRGLYDPAWRRLAARSYRRAARRCAMVVCPTNTTATEVVALLGAHRNAVVVVPYGPGQAEGAAPAQAGGAPDGPLLFVGDAEPRKNLAGLLKAYSAYRAQDEAPADLVLAGGAASAASAPGVTARADLSPAELLDLYRGARALVHPSLHEGFGFTPLEAMALGVPVLAVRNPGTEEVCGEAALLVSASQLAQGLRRIAAEPALRADLVRRGRERARCFSWAQAALGHERVYTLAMGNLLPGESQRGGGAPL